MGQVALDELAAALQGAIKVVQAGLDGAHAGRLERSLTLLEDGQVAGVSWRCRVDLSSHGKDRHLVLPLLTAQVVHPYRITRAVITFAGHLDEQTDVSHGASRTVRLLPAASHPLRRRLQGVLNFVLGRRPVLVGISATAMRDEAGGLRRRLTTRLLKWRSRRGRRRSRLM
jgi:hypothetical protein